MADVVFGAMFLALSVIFYVSSWVLYGNRFGILPVMYLSHILIQEIPAIYILFMDGGGAASLFFMINSLSSCLIAFFMFLILFFGEAPGGRRGNYPGRFDFLLSDPYKNRAIMIFYFCFCFVLLLLYMAKTGSSPLFFLLSGKVSGVDAVEARLAANAGQQGLVFGMALRFFMPMLFMMGVVSLIAGTGGSRFFSFFCVLVAFVYTAWAMDKTPVVALFVLLVLYLVFYRQEIKGRGFESFSDKISVNRALKKTRRILLFFCLLAVIYPVFIFSFLPASENGWGYVAGHIFKRLFFIPALNSYAAVDLFSGSAGFTFFKDISGYASLVGEKYFNLSFFVASHRGMIEGSYSPPAAIGNFYAQAGMVGVVLGVIFAVLVFKLSEALIHRISAPPIIKVPAYIILVYGAFRFSWANFHTILATEVVVPAIGMVIIARLLAHRWV